jgi:hypothetical protein
MTYRVFVFLIHYAIYAACLAAPALADTSGLAGADYSSVEGQVTKGLVGAGILSFDGGGFLTAAGAGYDDNRIGGGVSLTAGVGAPLGSVALARAFGTSWIGENDYRAWRLKAGPFFQWSGGTWVGLSFVRFDDGDGGDATGGMVEASVPIAPRWRAVATGAAASIGDGRESASGSAGVAWEPVPRWELQVEGGVARNGTLGTTGAAAGGGGGLLGGLPLLGRGQSDEAQTQSEADEENRVSGTLSMGLRVLFP